MVDVGGSFGGHCFGCFFVWVRRFGGSCEVILGSMAMVDGLISGMDESGGCGKSGRCRFLALIRPDVENVL